MLYNKLTINLIHSIIPNMKLSQKMVSKYKKLKIEVKTLRYLNKRLNVKLNNFYKLHPNIPQIDDNSNKQRIYPPFIKTKEDKKKFNNQHIFKYLSKRYIKQGIILTPSDLWSIAKKQKGLCAISGIKLKEEIISIDHIIPKSKGGSNEKNNIRLVTLNANIAKNDMDDKTFINLCQTITKYNSSLNVTSNIQPVSI